MNLVLDLKVLYHRLVVHSCKSGELLNLLFLKNVFYGMVVTFFAPTIIFLYQHLDVHWLLKYLSAYFIRL